MCVNFELRCNRGLLEQIQTDNNLRRYALLYWFVLLIWRSEDRASWYIVIMFCCCLLAWSWPR